MVEIKKLFEYNEEVRHRYLETLARMPWEELVMNREASFQSLRNIFLHTLNVIDYWLDVLLDEQLCAEMRYDEYTRIGEIYEYMGNVEKRLRTYVESLSLDGLARKYVRTNDLNEIVEVTAEDVLIHLFEEEVHHRGELIALLWQIGVEPPIMGWKYL
jgi:uncharacterized damage-inducible protein DinB